MNAVFSTLASVIAFAVFGLLISALVMPGTDVAIANLIGWTGCAFIAVMVLRIGTRKKSA